MPNIGDYGVVRTGGWEAAVIRFGTRSTVNHAVLYIGNGNIVEAEPGGAKISPAANYPNAVWSHMDLDPVLRQRIATWAEQQVGVPYGWLDIAALTLACLGFHNKLVAKRIERQDRLICSQLVDKAYQLAGVQLFNDGRMPGSVTPQDLLELIR